MPPKVGEKTTYKIYFTVANRTNEIENARFEMDLGEISVWSGSAKAAVGDIKSEGGKLIWDIGLIPANTGQFTKNIEASFEVSIVPRDSDIGKTLNLIDVITFTGIR